MKKLFLTLGIVALFVACQKDTSTQNMSSNDVLISGFDCSGVKITGTLKKGEVATNVSATLTYTGGNAKTYITKLYTSTGVTGLTASLLAGTLANGEGTLQFLIYGTPSTAGTASFSIDFGGKTCAISLKVEEIIQTAGINFTSIGTPVGSFQNNITDVDGNVYKTVKIGSQVWMAENLKTSKYNDGTVIPNVSFSTTIPAWSYYNNDSSKNTKYGKLYNWYTLNPIKNSNRNVCPIGWHVPRETEWNVLKVYLGDASSGSKMKEVGTTSWDSPNTDASNTSLFTGLPGGYNYGNGKYYRIGIIGYWWSSTDLNSSNAYYFSLNSSDENLFRSTEEKEKGFSVRCVKD